MLSLPLPVRVYLCLEPADMRRGFDGLSGMVRLHLDRDPLSGDLFVFRSKRGDRVKLLYWLEDGMCLWYKRLEEGVFVFPKMKEDVEAPPGATAGEKAGERVGTHGLEIRAADLAMLLDGVDLESVKRGKRYRRPQTPHTKDDTAP